MKFQQPWRAWRVLASLQAGRLGSVLAGSPCFFFKYRKYTQYMQYYNMYNTENIHIIQQYTVHQIPSLCNTIIYHKSLNTIITGTGCVAQWLERSTVKRLSSRRVGSNPTVFNSKCLTHASHGTLFQPTQL